MAELQVDAFAGCFGRDHDLCLLAEAFLCGNAVAQFQPAVDDRYVEALLFERVGEEVESVLVLCEDQQLDGPVLA